MIAMTQLAGMRWYEGMDQDLRWVESANGFVGFRFLEGTSLQFVVIENYHL